MKNRRPMQRPAPEALFGTFLEGLRDVYARGGMRDVLQLALAAAATAPPAAPADSPAPAASLAAVDDDELFEALLAALEDAFCRGGLDAAMHEFAFVGAAVGRAVRTPAGADAPQRGAGVDADRRAERFAQSAYARAISRHHH